MSDISMEPHRHQWRLPDPYVRFDSMPPQYQWRCEGCAAEIRATYEKAAELGDAELPAREVEARDGSRGRPPP